MIETQNNPTVFQSTISNRKSSIASLDSFYRWIPNELVKLQSQPRANVVREHPLRQFLRIEQAMRTVPGPDRIFTKRRRKQDCIHPLREIVPAGKLPRKFIVCAAAPDELYLVGRGPTLQVFPAK